MTLDRRDFLLGMAAVGAAGLLAPVRRLPAWAAPPAGTRRRLDDGWRFHRGDVAGAERPAFDDTAWERVVLPHTARLEALVTGEPGTPTAQWQGRCWYRRTLRLDASDADKVVLLHFEGAMNVAEVWLDGVPLATHRGGFLPFTLDLTGRLAPGRDAVLAVRLDNRDDPITGPKPLHLLDFQLYHGLYRAVHLIVKEPVHVTDALLADRVASGGLFVTYPRVSAAEATVRVQAHVRNAGTVPRTVRVRVTLLGLDGDVVTGATSAPATLAPGADRDVVQELVVRRPRLWSPSSPALHVVRVETLVDGRVTDVEHERIGIRRIAFARDGFVINGERRVLRGTNRHQEHPWVGNAVPDDAHWRDARRIKEAGFDYVRLSHYPHPVAFMDACDELGLVVMDCIPGWQYFGEDPAFAELQYRNCRELVRRDRNHPCVVLWEVSLNETAMPPEFVQRTHAIAHEEYPGDQCVTCGWVPGYDVLIRARQHGGCPADGAAPCVVSEYGDWEYYAMNAGLQQEAWAQLAPDASTSRQLRWHGEAAQLQQARNFQEAHDDNRAGPGLADGLWVMFDYNRGYAPDIESSGCADILRLPKYAWHFFRSQRDIGDPVAGTPMPATVFVASEWTAASSPTVRVFSNCDEVELRVNGRRVARQRPDRDRMSRHLAHPPFTFDVGTVRPGTLVAIGFVRGRVAARHVVHTPGAPARLRLAIDTQGRPLSRAHDDLVFVRGLLEDARGVTVGDAWENVAFGALGDVAVIGDVPFSSEAGIASVLLGTRPSHAGAVVGAIALWRGVGGTTVAGDVLALGGRRPAFTLHATLDGSEPTAASPRVTGPIPGASRTRAALVVDGAVLATIDQATPKFRIAGSRAPAVREEFRRGS